MPRPDVCIVPLGRAELAHSIQQHVFRQNMSEAGARRAWNEFERDSKDGVWKTLLMPEAAWERCIAIARRHVPALGVRTLDSLHVACALELNVQKFWTFDDRQAKLAEAVGLDTSA